ncbi:Uncharacterized protein conserved in bacteria [Serratia quinivorans]|uniref:type II toxin-antitoxin system PemK/MazF family toxin n=1 Tax=Serratia quinivorans TaxID=137545 RepID=UPI002177A154|nr:type II toxin-antitoxin system PemK/MazF family toxin [Serratia quinivorans]CAI0947910.1 Uncharacterized protein conserved in bacteria [Serratia quinivorans]CAI0964919.1 Uncharacterized protein conserved in bacteria [Serratia quinivorans]CAI1753347.1 Uncharacterized protein conserved in bacteria [Serratia quinivorans]CAI2099614.1 Uncharacterized protein conserved in bacteria [Serratia quinivorans]CAI2465114.1 Uncharacterized protein conserved in bacteria [Serratia quinivorans]
MPINFAPKVGEILECNYGNYPAPIPTTHTPHFYNGHIPPEMVKNRLIVVLNGKINGNACIIVPLSTTKDISKLNLDMHIEIAGEAIEDMRFFHPQTRWAKGDLVQQVSRQRLNRARKERGFLIQCLHRELVAEIQRAVIKSINARNMLLE